MKICSKCGVAVNNLPRHKARNRCKVIIGIRRARNIKVK